MMDKDVIERLSKVIGVGHFSLRSMGDGRNPLWFWRTHKKLWVKEICLTLRPHMGERRTQQINEVLTNAEYKNKGWAERAEREA